MKFTQTSVELKEKLLKLLPEQGKYETDMAGMTLYRHEIANKIERCFYIPLIIVILQGQKHSMVGSQKITYGENQCLITGVDLPISSYLTDVSASHPLLSITLPVDKYLISELSVEFASLPEKVTMKAMAHTNLDEHILDAFSRLTDLIENPQQAKIIAPMIIREIHYRLLLSPLGNQLRMISTHGNQSNQIAQSIDWLKNNYENALKVEQLAEMVNMSTSSFRRHFKLITTLTPLQYQKRLRLYDAQRLMLTGGHNATSACYAVGYESPTQFNREYKRMFGQPPHTDVRKLKAI